MAVSYGVTCNSMLEVVLYGKHFIYVKISDVIHSSLQNVYISAFQQVMPKDLPHDIHPQLT